ncbi:MAG: hypothetical protein EXQ79_06465 [Acidimicrobiia bacterium]|nr:hypothetical protein [Acidimicrobiia bacterium]
MQASVPDALATPSGDVLLIYVDASGIPETAGMRRLSDGGKTFTTVDFTITGLPPGAKVLDPNLVRLSDGRIRLYFYANPIGTPVDSQVEHTIASAISQDGVHFTYEGAVFAATGLVDPDVFQVGDAWLMYVFARGGTMVAHSTDGRAFVADGLLSPRNVGTTGPVHLADGRWRLYGFVQPDGAIVTYISRDDARTWEPEQGFRLKLPKGTTATDPQVVQLGAKRWRMYLKLAEADRSCMKPPPS